MSFLGDEYPPTQAESEFFNKFSGLSVRGRRGLCLSSPKFVLSLSLKIDDYQRLSLEASTRKKCKYVRPFLDYSRRLCVRECTRFGRVRKRTLDRDRCSNARRIEKWKLRWQGSLFDAKWSKKVGAYHRRKRRLEAGEEYAVRKRFGITLSEWREMQVSDFHGDDEEELECVELTS